MHEHSSTCTGCMDRRQMLVRAGGVTAVAAGVAVLAACGGSGDGDTPAQTSGSDGSLAKVADIPVGGAISATAGGQKVLLVQATAGVVTALSAICTHQGCTVAPGNGELDCPCHGSRYDLTGAVLAGPAKEALTPFDVHVKGDAVFAGAA